MHGHLYDASRGWVAKAIFGNRWMESFGRLPLQQLRVGLAGVGIVASSEACDLRLGGTCS